MPASEVRFRPSMPRVGRYLLLAGVAGLLVAAVTVPYLPRGTDLYVHVLWPWQVMRCLQTGSLPVWLPDLNAEFGSPGIGLYSPLSPTICGVLGLVFGTGGRGVRAALTLAVLLVVAVAPGRSRMQRLATAGCVLLSPAVLSEFFGRFPVAQLLALPLAWMLLERAVGRRWRWDRDGGLFALLWLLHAPTMIMVGMIAGLAVLPIIRTPGDTAGDNGATNRGFAPAVQLGLAGLIAVCLCAWHWWPLLVSAPDFSLRAALTEGLLHPMQNLIGVSGPHLPAINVSMGWAAVGLLVALLASGAWRTRRGLLAVIAIFLASVPSAPLWRLLPPLAWLQFPWRWMFPATLLATSAILDEAPKRGRLLLSLTVAAMFAPLAGIPEPRVVPDPALGVRTDPVAAGERIAASFSGNPLLIDVVEHRPLWWGELAETMVLLGPRRARLLTDGGAVQVVVWRPLRRELVVEGSYPTMLVLRLLADRHWNVRVNRRPVETGRWGAALAVPLPGGRSEVEVAWRTDPTATAGAIVALTVLAVVALYRRRLRSTADRP